MAFVRGGTPPLKSCVWHYSWKAYIPTEYTSEKSAHAHLELENVKKLTVMGTKSAPKKVEVSGVNVQNVKVIVVYF